MLDPTPIFMQRCIELAAKGLGHVAPNPVVGCVIENEGKIIGEGYHEIYGGPHAEVNAINSIPDELKHLLPQSTLYVSLEPCAHFGKTPPCADLIIANKIPRVVIGSTDPYPQVAGKGIQKLKNAGVEVITGFMQKETDFVNRRFITFYTKKRPYIILKWAESADGFMAPDEPKQLWLSNEASRKLVHLWRSEEQAVLVGKHTVETDNPELTVRLVEGRNPIRITIDRFLALQSSLKIFRQDSPLFLFNEMEDYEDKWLRFIRIDFTESLLPQMMYHLYNENIQSLMIEGGPYTLQKFIDENLWDEARIFTTPKVMKAGKKSPELKGQLLSEEQIQDDHLKIIKAV